MTSRGSAITDFLNFLNFNAALRVIAVCFGDALLLNHPFWLGFDLLVLDRPTFSNLTSSSTLKIDAVRLASVACNRCSLGRLPTARLV